MREMLLLLLAGCELGSQVSGSNDAGTGSGASLDTLPCTETLVQQQPMGMAPELGMMLLPTGFTAAWADNALVNVSALSIKRGGFAPQASRMGLDGLPTKFASIATSGGHVMLAAGSMDVGMNARSNIVTLDGDLHDIAPPQTSAVRALDSHALLANGESGLFVLAGEVFSDTGDPAAPTMTGIVGLDASGHPISVVQVVAAEMPQSVAVVSLDSAWAVVSSTGSRCGVERVDRSLGSLLPGANWGDASSCVWPTGAHIQGRTDMLLAWNDPGAPARIFIANATLSDSQLLIGTPRRVGNGDGKPRLVATSKEYWLAYRSADQLQLVAIDANGNPGLPTAVGNVAPANGYDLGVSGDTAVISWIDPGATDGLYVARACH